jgi:TPR repeat protein
MNAISRLQTIPEIRIEYVRNIEFTYSEDALMKPGKDENIQTIKKKITEVVAKGKITKEYFELLRKLADLGDSDALTDLGSFLQSGYQDNRGRVLIKQDVKAAMQCFLLGAAQGNTYAMLAVADNLVSSGKKGAFTEAEKLYKLAFKLGDAAAAFHLASAYQNLGKFTLAVGWYKRCLKAGEFAALLPLAYAELYGIGTRKDAVAALDKLRRVAKGGKNFCQFDQEDAMLIMADAFRYGWVVRRDLKAANSWLNSAAKLGSATAKGILQDYEAYMEHDHS